MEILQSIKDRIVYGEVPTAWDQFKKTLLERRLRGLIMAEAPRTFYVGKGLMAVFDEMLPVKAGRIDRSKNTAAVNKALNGLEVARAIVTNNKGEAFSVQIKDDGITRRLENASEIRTRRKDYQFGSMHTHPEDGLPSMGDVEGLLKPDNLFEIIVSPNRVIALFRTTDTSTFSSNILAQGYLNQMGVTNGKIDQFNEFYTEFSANFSGRSFVKNAWSLDYQDLKELRILGYEANRGSNVFVLRNR